MSVRTETNEWGGVTHVFRCAKCGGDRQYAPEQFERVKDLVGLCCTGSKRVELSATVEQVLRGVPDCREA